MNNKDVIYTLALIYSSRPSLLGKQAFCCILNQRLSVNFNNIVPLLLLSIID